MSVENYKKALFDSIMNLLWRQWVALGVSGYSAKDEERYVLDPESLIVFSAAFCRQDARLFDLFASWLLKYGRLINTTRLKALLGKAEYCDRRSLSYLAALNVEAGDKRWSRFAVNEGFVEDEGRVLFVAENGDEYNYCRSQDELALRYGWYRPTFVVQNKLRRELSAGHSTLLLRLRSLFGVSARAEVLVLLMQGAANIQQLSEQSGFVRSAVKEVLDELLMGNMASTVKVSGGRVSYVLKNAEGLMSMMGVNKVIFPDWKNIYGAFGKIWKLVSNPRLKGLSSATFKGELRHLFYAELQPAFLHCGVSNLEKLTEATLDDLPCIIAEM